LEGWVRDKSADMEGSMDSLTEMFEDQFEERKI
jgi:hypothetical protein